MLFGANTFALAHGARSITDTRSELGIRTDRSFALASGMLTLRGRLAWAHDFNPGRTVAATFQALPGASFVVNGAAQAPDSALATAAAEIKWRNGWSTGATFEGEFSSVTASYAGKGVVRYATGSRSCTSQSGCHRHEYPDGTGSKGGNHRDSDVLVSTGDPVMAGLVTSFNRPGGNVTGVGLLRPELETKRLELLDQLVPGTAPLAVLVNPMNPAADLQLRKLQEAAGVIKRQMDIMRASTASDIEMAFESAAQKGVDGLLVVQDPFYNSRRDQIVALGARYKRPIVYPLR